MSWNHGVRCDHGRSAETAGRAAAIPPPACASCEQPGGELGEDFYDEPIVVYRDFGLETVFVTDPELAQQILLDESDAFTKSPLYDDVLARAGGRGLLIAEGDDWR